MASKIKVVFELNSNQGNNKVKLVALHPLKRWVGIINQNNTFSLWNYQQKILIKSFNCNTLDDTPMMKGPIEVKEVVFFDRHCNVACEGVGTNANKIQTEGVMTGRDTMKNNIVFVTVDKLIFYDYIKDVIKPISGKDFEQKLIKRVCVYSKDKICIAMGDGSFKVLDIRDPSMKSSISIRNIRGYHVKPITWIFSYSQNSNQMPRVITASGQDGLMACWNIDMILKNPQNSNGQYTPCFKFTSSSAKNSQALNEEIRSLQYDPSSFRLVTVSDYHVRLWSTMTGMEIKRIKNSFAQRQMIFFNHFSYIPEVFLAHNGGTKVLVTHNSNGVTDKIDQIETRTLFPSTLGSENLQIQRIKSLPHYPSNICIVTNLNMIILEIDKFYTPAYATHPLFVTSFSTINSRQYINKAQGQIRKDIKARQIQAANNKFQSDILINTFYLSAESEWIWFNLLQIQYNNMLLETRKFKMRRFDETSCFRQNTGARTVVMVNFDGSEIIVFNKSIRYYEVYGVQAQGDQNDLIGVDRLDQSLTKKIDFYTHLRLLGQGYCKDICWHQFKNQFAVICGFDDKDRLVEYKVTREKKGFFRGAPKDGSDLKINYTGGQPVKFRVCLYQKTQEGYKVVQKSDPYESKVYKVFNIGSIFGYSVVAQKSSLQTLSIISDKNSIRETQGVLNCPQQIYMSYCESFFILAYDRYFMIQKVQQNGSMTYFRQVQQSILHGYFWEKFFLFITGSELYFMQIMENDVLMVRIASVSPPPSSAGTQNIQPLFDDDFEPKCALLPPGQQQIGGIINMNVILLNQIGDSVLISLQSFPYIVFCLQIASGVFDQSLRLFEKASKGIKIYMKKTLASYGMITPDLFQ